MSSRADVTPQEAVDQEQDYVSMLYGKLDDLRERASRHRAEVLRQTGGTPAERRLREDVASKYTQDMARLTAVDHGLCFGRLEFDDGGKTHIGRVGIFDGDHNPLLIDWRAPAARAFYLATAADPGGVTLRRQIRTKQRTVTSVSDEVLDLSAEASSQSSTITSEAALLSALSAERTGRMRDIVETIQGEQDRIIRSPLDGILVVQGGPGTGKTAVALHRAAYLLYAHRERLANRGVLLIGPNETFLSYIGDVLPGLAETDVLLRTIGDLYPGVSARRAESDEAAVIKGDPAMIEVIAAALGDRQRVPDKPVTAETEYGTLTVDPQICRQARAKARSSGKRHNPARPIFAAALLEALTEQIAERIGADPLEGENLLEEADLAEITRELREEPEVQAALDWLWPILDPQQLLAGLWGSDDRIATAAPELTAEQRGVLLRRARSGWTASDVPLLDEAAELLGEADDGAERERAEKRRAERLAYAQGVLDIVQGSRSIDLEDEDDPEILMATDVLDASLLGERQLDLGHQTTAERAAADRSWTFGHVVVDEAQELSAMAWRMIMRRCASRSMTVVGDLAQTGDPAGSNSWETALEPYAQRRWRREELTVSYRTPAEIMAVAQPVLARIDPELRVPRSVRSTGFTPWDVTVADSELPEQLTKFVASERIEVGQGRIGVIAAAPAVAQLRRALDIDDDLTAAVTILTVRQAKGLEFDAVIVVDPAAIEADSHRGPNDLYVALTRATRRLGVVHVEGN